MPEAAILASYIAAALILGYVLGKLLGPGPDFARYEHDGNIVLVNAELYALLLEGMAPRYSAPTDVRAVVRRSWELFAAMHREVTSRVHYRPQVVATAQTMASVYTQAQAWQDAMEARQARAAALRVR
jgi:hypothetical protein